MRLARLAAPATLTLALLAAPLAVEAQPSRKVYRIGLLTTYYRPDDIGCGFRTIMISQIGPSRSPGSVDRDHRDRHRDHGDRSIVITPRRSRDGASSPGRMAGA
jgi:hypothetical protein